jgi:hypothetical protein
MCRIDFEFGYSKFWDKDGPYLCNKCYSPILKGKRWRMNAITYKKKRKPTQYYHIECFTINNNNSKFLNCRVCHGYIKDKLEHYARIKDYNASFSEMIHTQCLLQEIRIDNEEEEMKDTYYIFIKNGKNLTCQLNKKYLERIENKIKDYRMNTDTYYTDELLVLEYTQVLEMVYTQYLLSRIKQELMEKVWHPSRFEKWKDIVD